jgi:diguanylate cyclase (GGDEF)-like protein
MTTDDDLGRALDAAQAEVASLRRQLAELARTDQLTGLSNRRHLDEHLDMVASGARRLRAASSLLLVDVDHLRRVNESYGLAAGDAVLRTVAERLASALRGEDMAGRWGDEELLAILPHTPIDGAWRLAERVRQSVCDGPVKLPTGEEIVVTVSVGVAEGLGDDIDDQLRRTDAALAEAKAAGRNRVVADTSTATP